MIPWLLAACAHLPPATALPPVEGTDGFVIRAGDRSLGGLAAVSVSDERFALLGLTPAGTSLFSIQGREGEPPEVAAPDPEMARVLGLLPFERDLWLLYRWRCEARCRTEHGRLLREGDTLRWRGRGGPATVELGESRTVLTDPRRHYTVTVTGSPR